MTIYELFKLVDDYRNNPYLSEVRFGCDCGCGGDDYTYEDWDQIVKDADEAKDKLESIGITFDD